MNYRFEDRIKLNKNRLLNYDDTYDDLYIKDKNMSWPGDFVGRYILALCSLYEGIDDINDKNEIFAKLENIINQRNNYVNKHHFFGDLFNDDLINEQQLSGNSWFIRSLVAYYKITKDKNILNEIKDIEENLLYKVAKHYNHYPLDDKRHQGEVSGSLDNVPVDGFLLSSDIGCAFILLDGFVDVYSILKDEKLKHNIENLINIFTKIDYIKLKCQTHATLTCTRSILRFYNLTNDSKYLDIAISIFDNYLHHGMTLDFQNINWFGKNDSWTEPCCVVDSFIIAHDLYLVTKDIKYLKLFNKIVNNGIRTFQRDNGGAGCTSIVLNKNDVLKCFMYEAWFCCSMRFGEGLKYLSSSRLIKQNNDDYLIMYPDKYNKDGINIDIDYYYNNMIYLKSDKDKNISIYVPDGIKITNSNIDYKINNNLLEIKLLKGKEGIINCNFDIINKNEIYYYGDMLLTKKVDHVDNIFVINNEKYSYILSSSIYKKEILEKIDQYL